MINRRQAALGAALLLCLIAAFFGTKSSADGLPALGADLSKTSVSGLSSGGYMAGQYQVAHSDTVIGAGIVAAGPFGCAHSAVAQSVPYFPVALAANLAQAENGCTANYLAGLDVLDSARLARQAARLADEGKIDPLSGLKRSRVYLYTGQDDHIVAAKVVEAARDFYLAAGTPPQNILFLSGVPADMPSLQRRRALAVQEATRPMSIIAATIRRERFSDSSIKVCGPGDRPGKKTSSPSISGLTALPARS